MRSNPELTKSNSEDAQEASSIFDRFRESKITRGAAVALGAAVLAGGGALRVYHDQYQAPEKKADKVAAVEVAKRFDCELVSLEDTGKKPKEQIGESAQRTTVKVRVNLRETPEAKPYIEKYAHDSAVVWFPPVVEAAVNINKDELTLPALTDLRMRIAGDPYQGTRKEDQYPDSLDVEFYPKTDYPDGKQARIYVSTSVVTANPPKGTSYTQYDMYGSMDCGAMVFDGETKSWKMLPHSIKSESVVRTEPTVFEDKDGDNVWYPAQETK